VSTPLVSIVIPVYNGMPFLRDALDCALGQTYANLEIVVIENNSSDGTAEYLQGVADDRLRVVYRTSTQPAAENWTQAVSESRGDFVKLMCADDLIALTAIERQVSALLAHPGSVLAACRRRIIDDRGDELKDSHGLGHLSGRISGEKAVRDCLLAGTNVLGEPAAVLMNGPLVRAAMPWHPEWPYMIDVATYADVLRSGDAVCEREVLASFRVSANSWSSQLLTQQPIQFRGWRDGVIASGQVPFSRLDRLVSEANLRVRTLGRRAYFRKVARRAAASSASTA
jgi:glycosyltransferase involved in cell wall biosynthesis